MLIIFLPTKASMNIIPERRVKLLAFEEVSERPWIQGYKILVKFIVQGILICTFLQSSRHIFRTRDTMANPHCLPITDKSILEELGYGTNNR